MDNVFLKFNLFKSCKRLKHLLDYCSTRTSRSFRSAHTLFCSRYFEFRTVPSLYTKSAIQDDLFLDCQKDDFTLAKVFSPSYHSPRQAAFTLAEVLVTLGIIGVVAALTLPTLIQNYQKHVTVNRLKVNFNILSNAVRMAEAEHGDITTWDEVLNSYNKDDYTDDNKAAAKTQAGAIVKKYIYPYLSGAKFTETESLAQLGYKTPIRYQNGSTFAPVTAVASFITLKNGTVILVGIDASNADAEGNRTLLGLNLNIDIDGPNGKNTVGKDVFIAAVPYAKNTRFMFMQHYGIYQDTQKLQLDQERDDILSVCKTTGDYCGALIQIDGWEIKDDYPG